MMDLAEASRILASFERHGVDYVLIGSMAMAAHGLVRATRVLDFFISPAAENVERLKAALKALYDDDENVDQILASELAGESIESTRLEIAGVAIRVATPRMLYRMKKDTMRPQDRVDAEMLRRQFDLDGDE